MVLTNIKNKQKESGFTIVELLVVIVVIGILAAITIVSYTGISAKATAAQNKSNAQSVMQAADAYFAENSSYPTSAQILASTTVKLPNGLAMIATIPAVGTPASITYVQAATGYCIQYWDPSTSPAAKATLSTAGTGASCL